MIKNKLIVFTILLSLTSCKKSVSHIQNFNQQYVNCVNEGVNKLLPDEKSNQYDVFDNINLLVNKLKSNSNIAIPDLEKAIVNSDTLIYNSYRKLVNEDHVYMQMLDFSERYNFMQNSCIRSSFENEVLDFKFETKLNELLKINKNLYESTEVLLSDLEKLNLVLNKKDKIENALYHHFLFLFMEKKMNPVLNDVAPAIIVIDPRGN
jgi:hypothetical protein